MVNADVVWMLVSTALVLLMTPALGFFYGGMVHGFMTMGRAIAEARQLHADAAAALRQAFEA